MRAKILEVNPTTKIRYIYIYIYIYIITKKNFGPRGDPGSLGPQPKFVPASKYVTHDSKNIWIN